MLSTGGRLTVIKSVLSCLPKYYMSLFEMPVTVCNNRIPSNFLWEGTEEVKKIHCVKWSEAQSSRMGKQQWNRFCQLLDRVQIRSDARDCLVWNESKSGIYSPKVFMEWILSTNMVVEDIWKMVWTALGPPKVEFFVWQLLKGRIPTKVELAKRGHYLVGIHYLHLVSRGNRNN
ncbi:hypothetical protein J1N35_045569 [Gossypium stocksii]|uniref:Reverse transcriptase zinc-binding domain-containing protein n=1 Tax=Gossypium stocksii TaxID=47602 RepID=A0A9D3ZH66_9ROSI|nr:hypothetical protein J1N35_045569 [Gossypium stocksii]